MITPEQLQELIKSIYREETDQDFADRMVEELLKHYRQLTEKQSN